MGQRPRQPLQRQAVHGQRIAEGLANAEKIKAELTKTEAARQEVLRQANAQAEQLLEEWQAAVEVYS